RAGGGGGGGGRGGAAPPAARRWGPGPGGWSAHEIVCHCADSESHASLRIRTLMVEPAPVIVGYDQERWAQALDYHAHPLDAALAVGAACRASTPLRLRRFPDEAWRRAGRHTESGA